MAAARWDSSSKQTRTHTHVLVARPPLARRSVPRWEKDFCESQGVPWKKVMNPDVGLNADAEGSIARWDDSGAVEALLAARRRYWVETNGGLRCRAVPPPPGPDLYCDVIIDDDGGPVDPELDAEYEEALRAMEVAWEQNENVRVLTASELPDDFVPVATGWDDDDV